MTLLYKVFAELFSKSDRTPLDKSFKRWYDIMGSEKGLVNLRFLEGFIDMADDIFETDDIITLTDEDGEEKQFQLLGSCELDGVEYLAMVPLDEDKEEYVILKREADEDGEDMLVTIDDDEEFDRVADIFEDELFGEIDYDGDESDE